MICRVANAVCRATCVACSLVASACAGRPESTDQVAQVPIIFAALKCAFAQALIEEDRKVRKDGFEYSRLKGRVAVGTLTLKIIHTANANVGAKAVATPGSIAGPFVFALGAGTASVIPSVSRTVKKTDTITTTIPFRFLLEAQNDDVCKTLSQSQRAKIGLSDWLANLILGLNTNVGYEPRGMVDKIVFSQDFGVVETTQGGVDFNFVFLSASAGKSSERNDVQTLEFTIAPPESKT